MDLQQGLQPKSSANGYGRRRVERDMNPKLENKFQSGKSNSSRLTNSGIQAGNKSVVYESPSRDRLVYMTTCLIGHHVEVQLKNGSIYCGIFHATDAEKDFGIILKMARMTKDGSLRGQKSITETINNAPSKTLIIPAKELVQVVAKDVSVTRDALSNELQREKQQEILIDSFISQSRNMEAERELEPWIPDEDNPQCPELDNIFDGQWNSSRSWDQFETNETLFGVKSTFNEELYTTKLERGPQMRDLEKEAVRIAREIEGEETHDLHLAEERGRHLHENFDIDEETRFSSVYRGTGADDSGYEENEDLIVDSHNTETFGGSSFSAFNRHLPDVTGQKSDDRAGVLSSSSSLDEAQSSQSNIPADLYRSSSLDHARQLASEHPVRSFPASDGDNRIQDNYFGELEGSSNPRGLVEIQMQAEDVQFSESEDSLSSLMKRDGFDKGGLSPDATAYAPSHVSSKGQGKSSSSGLSEGPSFGSANSHRQPSGSTSSALDRGAAAVSSGPGLSPSSSMGSLSSEKSALNPHAKEFKLNPNAKSFIPSQNPVRPPSPVSDGSFYFPNASGVPQMHGMPLGIGIGPSFGGHQPVIFNPQGAPLQSPQAYLHPNGPQYGQQMLLGHPRQVLYMPGYPPEMQYKGRDF